MASHIPKPVGSKAPGQLSTDQARGYLFALLRIQEAVRLRARGEHGIDSTEELTVPRTLPSEEGPRRLWIQIEGPVEEVLDAIESGGRGRSSLPTLRE